MRHRKSRFQLNRFTSWRKATLRSLARALVLHQSIRTTLTKAKAVKPLAEELVGLAKTNTLTAKRRAFDILSAHKLVKVLFDEIGPRFAKRQSGYTRIINLGSRRGDNAKVVILEFTEIQKKEKKAAKKHKEAKAQEKPSETAAPEKKPAQEKKAATQVIEKPPLTKKPTKSFLGGIKNIFKKERDSL